MVVLTCNPSTQEAEAGGWQVWASVDYIVRLSLKNKTQHTYIVGEEGEHNLKQR
jgi:hypothetical protein